MKLEEFNYILPKELIAQFPSEIRENSRLIILNRQDHTIEHKNFFDLTQYLKSGDVLILNNTKVIPARLIGKKTTGGTVEILLLNKSEIKQPNIAYNIANRFEDKSQIWNCLINKVRGLKAGSEIIFALGLVAEIIEKAAEEGIWIIKLNAQIEIDKAIELAGKMPLPPYIKRDGAEDKNYELDNDRYQTIFATEKGAIAAPTAGLHFTKELLEKIKNLGAEIHYITLHTGIGTFKPVKVDDIQTHKMGHEQYNIDNTVFEAIIKAKKEKRRVIAVGTTATRALESMVQNSWEKPILSGTTDLFIYPGYKFKIADALLTNFHLPKSTLIMLASAFAGKDFLMRAYKEAIHLGYRFFSYGDAMLIL